MNNQNYTFVCMRITIIIIDFNMEECESKNIRSTNGEITTLVSYLSVPGRGLRMLKSVIIISNRMHTFVPYKLFLW